MVGMAGMAAVMQFDGSPLNFLVEHSWGSLSLMVIDLALRAVMAVVIVIRKAARPSVATAWILIVVAFPFVGVLAYLLVGESHLGRQRRRIHREILRRFDTPRYHRHDDARAHEVRIDQTDAQISRLARQASHSEPLAGNRVQLLESAQAAAAAMVADIDAAAATVHLTSYIWLDDRVGRQFQEALIRASRRGVACRVLVDGQGSRSFLRSDACRQMRSEGVRVVAALPTHYLRALFHRIDVRNHRKLMVVDGTTGWLGSMNIAAPEFAVQPRFAPWVDCMVRIDGPTARELQLIFAEDWFLDTGESLEAIMVKCPPFHEEGIPAQIMASGPNYDNDAIRSLLIASIQVARKELVLTTPYFVPDSDMFSAICVAAQRGVAVSLVVPHLNNSRLVGLASRARYEALLKSGVAIHEYRKGLLHAKTVSVDNLFAIVTSSNLDRRSFEINFEASAIFYDDHFAARVRDLQAQYISRSTRVELADYTNLPFSTRLARNAAALLSPLI